MTVQDCWKKLWYEYVFVEIQTWIDARFLFCPKRNDFENFFCKKVPCNFVFAHANGMQALT